MFILIRVIGGTWVPPTHTNPSFSRRNHRTLADFDKHAVLFWLFG